MFISTAAKTLFLNRRKRGRLLWILGLAVLVLYVAYKAQFGTLSGNNKHGKSR